MAILRLTSARARSYIDGWVSADIVRDRRGNVLKLDATKPWPFPPESLSAVNSEHFIEHVSRRRAAVYLREALPALQPGAPIRTSTPDLEALSRAYTAADLAILEEHRRQGYQAENHADLVNNYFYCYGHRHIYDFATLADCLPAAGFERIQRARFGESEHEVLRGIDCHDGGPLNALVLAVDAVKPLGPRAADCSSLIRLRADRELVGSDLVRPEAWDAVRLRYGRSVCPPGDTGGEWEAQARPLPSCQRAPTRSRMGRSAGARRSSPMAWGPRCSSFICIGSTRIYGDMTDYGRRRWSG